MRKKISTSLFVAALAFCLAGGAWAVEVHLSGGGTNVISDAITANANTGARIVIDDSATYTQTADVFLGPRNSGTYGRRGFRIVAAAGETPTIVLSGCRIVMYSGSADCRLGYSEGGRITVNATAAAGPAIWYIGQEDGATGTACHAMLENLNIDFGGVVEGIVFGGGSNDAAPVTTGAKLSINRVKTTGGVIPVRVLYGPASYASTVDINQSAFIDARGASVELGQFGLGGPSSRVNIIGSVMYVSPTVPVAELNCVVGFLGQIVIDHCDIINEGPTAVASRGVVAVGANIPITNSIIRGDAGTINWGAGTCTVDASNVTATTIANAGFTYGTYVEEWPVYVAYGADPSVADWFVVDSASQSATFGSSPPLGNGGQALIPVELSSFSID